ncbi:hypothetical protein [Vallitalea guaymasensis]|uniref:hypothetical protein n=1 Tax=Vallitalea guaymasensis TaxID=1185412 RepID=UPI000DE2369E|nr:hypothetical protein [Vallitalea guaymasensis]
MELKKKQLGYQDFEGFVRDVDIIKGELNMAFVGGGQGGSKIVSELIRLGYYGFIYNTCKKDNDYVEDILKSIDSDKKHLKYDILTLDGYEGAFKDRETGQRAIIDNQNKIKENVIEAKPLREADFVWVVVALGGGTGNGSLNIISQTISKLRSKQKFNGTRPTVGVIAAVPEGSSFHKIEKNATDAINEIRALQKKKIIGSCILIDNDKLMNDYINSQENTKRYKEWTAYGNLVVSRILAEINGVLNLNSSETFDKSEALDILTLPVMLSLGKMKITKATNFNKDTGLKGEEEYFDNLIEEALTKYNVLADGYDIRFAFNPGLIIVKKTNSKVLTDRQAQIIRNCLRKKISNSMAEKDHFGIHFTKTTGTYKKPSEEDEAIIYVLLPFLKLPKRINEMVERINNKVNYKKSIMKDYEEIDLGNTIDDFNIIDETVSSTPSEENELEDLDFSKLGNTDMNEDLDEIINPQNSDDKESQDGDDFPDIDLGDLSELLG